MNMKEAAGSAQTLLKQKTNIVKTIETNKSLRDSRNIELTIDIIVLTHHTSGRAQWSVQCSAPWRNIPIPSNKDHQRALNGSAYKHVTAVRWRTFFFQNPHIPRNSVKLSIEHSTTCDSRTNLNRTNTLYFQDLSGTQKLGEMSILLVVNRGCTPVTVSYHSSPCHTSLLRPCHTSHKALSHFSFKALSHFSLKALSHFS